METQTIETDKEQLSPELLNKMNACWRPANYLSVGQIYLHENPLLREPLKPDSPGQVKVYLQYS